VTKLDLLGQAWAVTLVLFTLVHPALGFLFFVLTLLVMMLVLGTGSSR
jgi:hypothetical protein